jgi:hypothetical protein
MKLTIYLRKLVNGFRKPITPKGDDVQVSARPTAGS